MIRIGVLGGTFNPIHIGHLAIAHMAMETMKLDKVIFVPAYLPPHKDPRIVAPSHKRAMMVRLAIKDNPRFSLSDFEIKKRGKSYTVETMRYFCDILPVDVKLFFIIGGDTLGQLKKWRYIEDILKIATFIVVNRPGQYRKTKGIAYLSVSMPGIDISSSYVRRRIAEGKTVKYFVPENVISYIRKHKLYRSH